MIHLHDLLTKGAVLAPMAGVTDMPFRVLCLQMGAAYTVTEMVSAKGILMSGTETRQAHQLLCLSPEEEGRTALQLFGHEPDVLGRACALLAKPPYFMLDLNLGCPVPKVTGNGEGSALLKDPGLCCEIFSACIENACIPVSVKLRLGFDAVQETYLEVAKAAERAGIALITLHARTRQQYYQGQADWTKIRLLKETVSVPVIGNGDVFSWQDAVKLRELTGCDGIACARGAQGNPFLFRQISAAFQGKEPAVPTLREREETALLHLNMLAEMKGEYIAVREMRRHAVSYVRGLRDAVRFRRTVNEVQTLPEMAQTIHDFFTGTEEEAT